MLCLWVIFLIIHKRKHKPREVTCPRSHHQVLAEKDLFLAFKFLKEKKKVQILLVKPTFKYCKAKCTSEQGHLGVKGGYEKGQFITKNP